MAMPPVLTLIRYAVFAAVAVVAVLAFAALAVQRRMINPFGRPARTIRDATDPLLKPIERRVLRSGGNPQSAPWWLVGIALIGGIVLISGAQWAVGEVRLLGAAARGGGRPLAFVLVDWTFSLINLALLIRVIGSWLGFGQYNKWMRPFYYMTEWFLAPLRRLLPPFGPIDVSPLVAWLVIAFILRPAVLRLLL